MFNWFKKAKQRKELEEKMEEERIRKQNEEILESSRKAMDALKMNLMASNEEIIKMHKEQELRKKILLQQILESKKAERKESLRNGLTVEVEEVSGERIYRIS